MFYLDLLRNCLVSCLVAVLISVGRFTLHYITRNVTHRALVGTVPTKVIVMLAATGLLV